MTRRHLASALVALASLAVLAVACTTAPVGGGTAGTPSTSVPGSTTTTVGPNGDDSYTIAFIGDSEPRMRGNTNAEVSAYIANLAAYRTTRSLYFDYGGGDTHRVSPELVVLGGDISADRDTSIDTDMPLWQQLYDKGIGMVAGFGNHDWEPVQWSDGSLGYSLAGHTSNLNTTAFTRETYRRSANTLPGFTYREFGPTSSYGPTTFLSSYKGVDLANFNTFLYQPSYTYPDGWPLSCNLLSGGAGCQIFASAEPQIAALAGALSTDPARTTLFMEHYPLTTGDGWWDDYGASGTTLAQRKARLLGLMTRFDNTALLAGHNHSPGHYTHVVGGRTLDEYVAPYFGGDNGEDLTRGGGFVALLVSPTKGILEVKFVPGGI
ncbi:MAG: hypothetical protein ACOYOP_13120 [Microthrixaceae bacterium]